MQKYRIFGIIILAAGILVACGGGAGNEAAVKAVGTYLQALVNKDADRLVTASCAQWEEQARLEVDSFQAVTAKLEGLSCEDAGKDGEAVLVICQGKIVTTYNDENQTMDLSLRAYRVVEEKGEWRVCGYK